jgi:hypothetical protein
MEFENIISSLAVIQNTQEENSSCFIHLDILFNISSLYILSCMLNRHIM